MREFRDVKAFVAFMERQAARLPLAQAEGLTRGAEIIRHEAQHALGQDEWEPGEPFLSPWLPLADSTNRERERLGFPPDEPGLRTGDMRYSVDVSAGSREAVVGSNEDKAVWFERGTYPDGAMHQPPRSFLGGAAFRTRERVVPAIVAPIVRVLAGGGRVPTE